MNKKGLETCPICFEIKYFLILKLFFGNTTDFLIFGEVKMKPKTIFFFFNEWIFFTNQLTNLQFSLVLRLEHLQKIMCNTTSAETN
jgi:hypothetical protein